jgi:excisionase family DNA binding protein
VSSLPTPKKLLTTQEVAVCLSISTRTVWRKVARGDLPAPVRLGRRLPRWRAADIHRYIQRLHAAS